MSRTTTQSKCADRHASTADRRRALGALGETLACEHFTRLGFTVLARNVRTRHGEIDLIAFDGHTLAFVEIKTSRAKRGRSTACEFADAPLSRLRHAQRARLRRLAGVWLSEQSRQRPTAREIRFDAVGVILDGEDKLLRLDHLEAAW